MQSFFSESVVRGRVLLLLPTRRDAEVTAQVLAREGIHTTVCGGPAELAREIARGAGAVFVCEETLPFGAHRVIADAVASQPRWSDLPVLILTRDGDHATRQLGNALAELGNVMLLERPLRLAALSSNVRTALRARERQYQIHEHLVELAEARDALAAVAQRKDEFLAMLGHELRNPLAPIRNALHLFGSERAVGEAEQRELHSMMKRQVDHMVRLVDDLIDVSRISRGAITLRRERVDLYPLLRNAVEQSRPLIEANRHALVLDLPERPVAVDADPVRMTQVFGNLLNNAAKYTRPGGRIVLSARVHDGGVRVSVRDNGIGIEPEMLAHVFELFTQGRREAHRAQDGLGIGLTLVRSIVEMHGGRVHVESAGRGAGSEFRVDVPLLDDIIVATPDRTGTADELEPERLRAVVVDDNVDSAQSMGMVLDLIGIENRVVFDGTAALAAIEAFRPDVVLLDIGMPGLDGYEVARRLRANPMNARLMLIALTGWSQTQDQERSRKAGFDHHFSKPIDIEALQALLATLQPAATHA